MYNLLRKKNVALSESFKPRISTFINRADGEFEVFFVGISYFLCVGMWDLNRKRRRRIALVVIRVKNALHLYFVSFLNIYVHWISALKTAFQLINIERKLFIERLSRSRLAQYLFEYFFSNGCHP